MHHPHASHRALMALSCYLTFLSSGDIGMSPLICITTP